MSKEVLYPVDQAKNLGITFNSSFHLFPNLITTKFCPFKSPDDSQIDFLSQYSKQVFILSHLHYCKNPFFFSFVPHQSIIHLQTRMILALRGSSVGQCAILTNQGCGFDLRSRHVQEATSECIKKWKTNRFLSLSQNESMKQTNKKE